MGFRNKEGDYLGSQNNYQYTGKRSLDQRSTKKSYTNIIAILVIIVFLAALFLLYVALSVKDPNVNEGEYLFSSITLFILAFYIMYRFRNSKKEEAKYQEELQKLNNDQ